MVAYNVIIVIHLIYSCPISMLMVVVVKFIYQNSVIHAVNVGRQDINKSALKKRVVRKSCNIRDLNLLDDKE